MSDIVAFKANSAAQDTFRRIGLADVLAKAHDWIDLQELVIDYNDRSDGEFVKRARKFDGVASSGERVLLHAILATVDFAWLADELCEGRSWRQMDNVSGAHRRAVASCIARDAA